MFKNPLLRNKKNKIIHFERDFLLLTSEIENSRTKELRRVNVKTGEFKKYPNEYSFNVWEESDIRVINNKENITLFFLGVNLENDDETDSFPVIQLILRKDDLDYESVVILEGQTFNSMKNFPMNRYTFLTSEDNKKWLMSVDRGEVTFTVLSESDWDPFCNDSAIDLGNNRFIGMNREAKASVYRIEEKEKSSESTTEKSEQ